MLDTTEISKRLEAATIGHKSDVSVSTGRKVFYHHAHSDIRALLAEVDRLDDGIRRALNGPWPTGDLVEAAKEAGDALQAIGKATGRDWSNYPELPVIVGEMRATVDRQAREIARAGIILHCILTEDSPTKNQLYDAVYKAKAALDGQPGGEA